AGDGVARGTFAAAAPAPPIGFYDPALQHRPVGLEALADDLQPELVKASERGQARADEGSVRHVEVFPVGSVRTPIIGRPRPLSDERRADTYARTDTGPSTPWIRKSPMNAQFRTSEWRA